MIGTITKDFFLWVSYKRCQEEEKGSTSENEKMDSIDLSGVLLGMQHIPSTMWKAFYDTACKLIHTASLSPGVTAVAWMLVGYITWTVCTQIQMKIEPNVPHFLLFIQVEVQASPHAWVHGFTAHCLTVSPSFIRSSSGKPTWSHLICSLYKCSASCPIRGYTICSLCGWH